MPTAEINQAADINAYSPTGADCINVKLAQQSTAYQHKLAWTHLGIDPIQHF
jgi:hypothetical protein